MASQSPKHFPEFSEFTDPARAWSTSKKLSANAHFDCITRPATGKARQFCFRWRARHWHARRVWINQTKLASVDSVFGLDLSGLPH